MNNRTNKRFEDEDRGTILEPIPMASSPAGGTIPRPVSPADVRETACEPIPAASEARHAEQLFRPVLRPPVARLKILDDGDLDSGETFWLRNQSTLIGRTDGAVRLPHDPLVSGSHAEIVREGSAAPVRWILRDLGSSNGTFVCCSGAPLKPDRLIILGGRRFRFQPPEAPASTAEVSAGTALYDTRQPAVGHWPALVETTKADEGVRIPLNAPSLRVGRPGFGNQVELNDPLLAPHHAMITRTAAGEWRIDSLPSRNGLWMQVRCIRLSGHCRFQCGEQRFLFLE